MKILTVSHTYIVDLNCEKLRSLARIDPTIEVTVVVPKRWNPGGVQSKAIESKLKEEDRFSIVPISNFSQNNQGLLSFGVEIVSLLRRVKPDIIQVEQGAKSLGYAELITLNHLLNLKAKNVFFTWWNLPYKVKFPVSLLEGYNLRHTDGLVAGNQDGADILREHGYDGPVCVMPQLGVDEVLFQPEKQPALAEQLGIRAEEFVIGFAGRFVEEKGLVTLFNALQKLSGTNKIERPWKLLLLGRGPLEKRLKEESKTMGFSDRIIWLNSVPHADVPKYINMMDTLVLPSETTYATQTLSATGWKEQFGHVIIEAMACQVPVIGSDSGEIPHVIKDSGLIFPEGDAASLAEKIATLINSPEQRRELARRGRDRVLKKYTNTALASQLLSFYETLL